MYKEGVSYGNVSIPCHGITGKECIEETSCASYKLSFVLFIYDTTILTVLCLSAMLENQVLIK